MNLFSPDRNHLLNKWQNVLENTKRVWTWTTDGELAWLAEMVQLRPRYLELGSYVGRSATVVCRANPRLTMVSIDTWDDYGTKEEYEFNTRDFNGRITAIQGSTHHVLDERHFPEESFDCAFIDAGHLYDDVKGDIARVLPLLKKGGILAGHDYRHDLPNDGVTRAVNEAFPNRHLPIDSIWAVKL